MNSLRSLPDKAKPLDAGLIKSFAYRKLVLQPVPCQHLHSFKFFSKKNYVGRKKKELIKNQRQ